ncbi:MAG TPA: tRNA1(Val) (adenine(37)-N6)-methyltransferase [Candidatus Dorea intestinavium]|nr:tRNA1(Val) (adenine(37)-N6)-methyltransferase [Candidatus Dorea intestinavium]
MMNNKKERIDDLQIKDYKIIQDPERFCFGIDAVLLSDFAKVKKDEWALDLGCGNGIIPLLLEAKNQGEKYFGLELQKESAALAKRSVALNGLEEKILITEGDIKEAADIYQASSFSVITTNPPYMLGGHGQKNENEALLIARHETACTIDDILEQSRKLLRPKGRFYMVHRPFRLPELFIKMAKNQIEPKKMQLVYPSLGKEPNLVLIEGVKEGRPRLQVMPPLIVYGEDGKYTKEVRDIYEPRTRG